MIQGDRWQRVKVVLDRALDVPPEARPAFLEEACGDDALLRRQVESFLEAGDESADFLVRPFFSLRDEGAPPPHVGHRVGPYRLLRQLGRGGMATVYLAERVDGGFEQQVAVKLLQRGMDTDEVLRRFAAERQILAGLVHTHIAKLHDGGTTESGLPYFVMEYLEGTAIDAYCDRHRLSVAERIQLFRSVCSAVGYAHRNLVIHRDIKPANILVTGDGTPKLLDFGIAKLLAPAGFPQTLGTTLTALRPMTPSYASPEQVGSGTITTATDVYSLGVLLHQLLTGLLPYRLEARTPQALEDAILRAEPIRPSAAILRPEDGVAAASGLRTPESIAERRSTSPRQLRRQLEGDLDTIVLMALRKDPQRRYGSVEQLSEDLRRFLEGLPVVARADTFGYRARKFVRRNRLAVASVAGFMAVVLGFAVAMTLLATQLARERDSSRWERDRAELERGKAEQVMAFFTDIFELADPREAQGDQVTVREVLDRGRGRIGRELAGQPEIQAALFHTIGEIYYHLGLYEEAVPLAENAWRLRRETLGSAHPNTAESLSSLASALQEKGDLEEARSLQRIALVRRETTLGEDALEVADSLLRLAWFERFDGDFEEAQHLTRRALAIRRQRLGSDHPEFAAALHELAVGFWEQREMEAAEDLYREALRIARRHLGEDHPDILMKTRNLAILLRRKGDLETAEKLAREVLAAERRVNDLPDHPRIAATLNLLASVQHDQGELGEAEALYRESLEMRRQRFGGEHPIVAVNLGNLAHLLSERGDYAAAARLQRQSLEIGRKNLSAGSPHLAFPLLGLGGALVDLGEPGQAEPLLREALAIRRAAFPERGGYFVAEAELELGRCLTALGAYGEAESLLLGSHPILMSQAGSRPNRTRRMTLRSLVDLYRAWGKPEAAAGYLAQLEGLPAGDDPAADGGGP